MYIDWLERVRKQKNEKEKIKLFTNKSDIEKKLSKPEKKIQNRTIKFLPE
jgi:hypothetical protein